MVMNDTLGLMLGLLMGVLLGAMFFGGLWWTVQKGVSSNRPVLWFFGSMLLRTSMPWLVSILSRAVIGRGCWYASLDFSSHAWS
jgi:F1F0 ATPase subunit 2